MFRTINITYAVLTCYEVHVPIIIFTGRKWVPNNELRLMVCVYATIDFLLLCLSASTWEQCAQQGICAYSGDTPNNMSTVCIQNLCNMKIIEEWKHGTWQSFMKYSDASCILSQLHELHLVAMWSSGEVKCFFAVCHAVLSLGKCKLLEGIVGEQGELH